MMDYDLDGCITLADYQTWLAYYRDANAGSQTVLWHFAGDVNCDGVISYADIAPFVLAISDRTAYEHRYFSCDFMLADIDGDGYANYGDINAFVALLSGY